MPPHARSDTAPAVVLVEPQLPENIGMAARAMLNCGLDDLRLVRPKPRWPHDKARAAASGADRVIENARLFETTAAAIADLSHVYATTSRFRDLAIRVVTPRQAAAELRAFAAAGQGRAGVLFGKESKGLHNDDVVLAEAVISVPLNPAYRSLNLAQAVFALGYEWFTAADATPPAKVAFSRRTRPATKEELLAMFEQLESALDECGFLRVKEKRPTMVRNLRVMFQRAGLSEQEVRTFRGVIACLGGKRGRKR